MEPFFQRSRPFRRIGFECLGFFVTRDLSQKFAGCNIVKLILPNFRTVGEPGHYGNLLSVLQEHPVPDHVAVVQSTNNASGTEQNNAQREGVGRTAVLDLNRPPQGLSICSQLYLRKSNGIKYDYFCRALLQRGQLSDDMSSVTVDDVKRTGFIAESGAAFAM